MKEASLVVLGIAFIVLIAVGSSRFQDSVSVPQSIRDNWKFMLHTCNDDNVAEADSMKV